jgi:hypothetical protein
LPCIFFLLKESPLDSQSCSSSLEYRSAITGGSEGALIAYEEQYNWWHTTVNYLGRNSNTWRILPIWIVSSSDTSSESPSRMRSSSFAAVWEDRVMRGTFCEHDDELFDGEVHTEEFSCRGTNGDLRTFFLLEVIQPEPSDFSK